MKLRRSPLKRAKRILDDMEHRAFVACYPEFGISISGLRGCAFSVDLNGWDRASKKWSEECKRRVKQYMRFAKWLDARNLWRKVIS